VTSNTFKLLGVVLWLTCVGANVIALLLWMRYVYRIYVDAMQMNVSLSGIFTAYLPWFVFTGLVAIPWVVLTFIPMVIRPRMAWIGVICLVPGCLLAR
jgi:hypothetical protein